VYGADAVLGGLMILDKNIEALREYRKVLLARIEAAEISEGSEEGVWNVESEPAVNGSQVMTIFSDTETYRLNSLYNPEYEADIWAEQIDYDKLFMRITVIGFGNGIFIRAMKNHLKKDDVLIVYEPSLQIFQYVLEQEDISDILKAQNVHLFIKGINEEEFLDDIEREIGPENLNAIYGLTHPEYNKMYPEACSEYLRNVYEIGGKMKAARGLFEINSKDIVENHYQNVSYLKEARHTSGFSKKIPKDVPVIIVSAGPSLDKNIDMLKKAEGKAVIIALTRNLDILYEHNITPDMVAVVDPVAYTETFDFGGKEADIPLLCTMNARWYFLDKCKNNLILASTDSYFKRLAKLLGRQFPFVGCGGSVATMAFAAAREMGFKTFIFVGQDLAYDGDVSHAGGVKERVREQNIERDGVNGGKVQVRYDWYIYLRQYEEQIALMTDCEVIDATEGGAKIEGTTIMTLEEAIRKHCKREYHFREEFEKIEKVFRKTNIKELLNM